MKTMSKRTKSILTIAGSIVVLALVAALVITQTPLGGLLGAAKISITPPNASIVQGATIGLQVNAGNCAWKSSNVNVATLQSTAIGTAQFKGVGPGTTKITANCGFAGTASTTLTVVPPPTATPAPTPTSSGYFGISQDNGSLVMHVNVQSVWLVLNPPGLPCVWDTGVLSGNTWVGRFQINMSCSDPNCAPQISITPLEVTGEVGGILTATCGGVTARRDVTVLP